ncbi:MAG: ATP-dependent DNA helicase [Firmicutes bacterium]|nr:ATP-dependent DNA helicase [Bacillota bacterium]
MVAPRSSNAPSRRSGVSPEAHRLGEEHSGPPAPADLPERTPVAGPLLAAAESGRDRAETAARQWGTVPTLREIFGPGGLLEQAHPAYEFRPSQLEMAELVERAFREKRHVIVEAGTGTGKTLSYLIPAIRSGRRVVVSTATKSLQEQLFTKDIPFLQKHFAPDLKVAVMKGRANFLCRQKVRLLEGLPVLKGLDEVDWFRQICAWEKLTETGDRAELTFLPDDSDLWSRLDARRDTCTGQKCPEFQRCFITWMHQRAHEADIVIVNHHLFFADLAIRTDEFGSILPDYAAVVFDEAHEIEDVASEYFGQQTSNYRFEELARDAEHTLRLTGVGTPALLRRVQQLRERARSFFELFPAREGRFPFALDERAAFLERNAETHEEFVQAIRALETEIAALPNKPEEILRVARRAMELRQGLAFLLESQERNYVYWFERRNRGVFLAATPIDVSGILRERLFAVFDTVVLTSATLAVGGRFDYLKQRLGIDTAIERVLPHEFDYSRQALLYIPPEMPDIRESAFVPRAAQEIARLLEITRGRAFCLFTSYSQMREVYEHVKTLVPFPLLLQGTAPRSVLLERFKGTEGAVLFATATFWQGVDVPGAALSCVCVDRLPFAVPTDPVVAARVRALSEEGRNAFAEYQIPEAVIALKQGFGRLIRSRSDQGVLALLDTRIVRMPYGRLFFESLPEYARTQSLEEVARFMRSAEERAKRQPTARGDAPRNVRTPRCDTML